MTRPSVLAIGIDPDFADAGALGGLTPEIVRAYIEAQVERLRQLGFEAESCLVDLGEHAGPTVTRVLQSRSFDCIVIGAGLRQPPERLLLFEEILNLVHALAPQSRIAFNTTPADTAEAVGRWIAP
jgi:hypothetical protein